MVSLDEARRYLDEALREWEAGRYYEAHEILEELAECFEEDDPSFEYALALTRIASSLHKLSAGVGVQAVPGKLKSAIEGLSSAPDDWCGLDLSAFRRDLDRLMARIGDRGAVGVSADIGLPVPRTIAAGSKGE